MGTSSGLRRVFAITIALVAAFQTIVATPPQVAVAVVDTAQVAAEHGTQHSPAPSQPNELVDRRTATSRTVDNGDGTLTSTFFVEPVHYQDGDGAWQVIDSRVVSDERAGFPWRSAANSFTAFFRGSSEDGLLRFEGPGASFDMGLQDAGARGSQARGTTLRFPGVMRGVDIEYEVGATGVKETLVLADADVRTRYNFWLRPSGDTQFRAEKQADGSWAFFASGNAEPAFVLAAPTVFDSSGENVVPGDVESPASMTVQSAGAEFLIALSLDREWLRAPARQFPVFLDPTITVQPPLEDANFASNCSGCTPNVGQRLWMGANDSYIWRPGIQFDLGNIPAGSYVTGATLSTYYDGYCIAYTGAVCPSTVSHQINAHRMTAAWTTSTTTANVRFDATVAASYTLPASATARWMTWSLTSVVRDWVSGAQPNYGLLLKRSTEALKSGGPAVPGRRYTGEATVRPKLDVTYTSDAVTLNEPAILHSNGADLSWTRFAPPSGAAFQRYEVHRSSSAVFTPSATTLLATITDINVTSYRDTTAAPSRSFTYRIVANLSASNARTVTLPVDGQASMVLQPAASDGKATYAYYASGSTNCANYGRDDDMFVGTSTTDKYRPLLSFDIRRIPTGATIRTATLSVWHRYTQGTAATINLHRITRAWQEGTGLTQCTGDGATWYDAQSGVKWTTAGGDYSSTVSASVANAAGEVAGWDSFTIPSLVQQWVNGQVANYGVIMKYSSESLVNNNNSYFSDDYTVVATQRPKLTVTYDDGSHAIAPTVSIAAPASGAVVSGSAVPIAAAASDDRRVDKVEFFVRGVLVGSDTTAPFTITWNSSSVANGVHSISARATDDAGNATTSAAVNATVENSAPPTTSVTSPAGGDTVTGSVTVSANASDDFGVARVEFFFGGIRFAEDTTAPYQAAWNTLDPAQPAYDGSHTLTTKAYDTHGMVTESADISVTVANTVGTLYRATLTTTAVPQEMVYDPAGVTQEQYALDVTVTNNSSVTWPRSDVALRYRWHSPDAPAVITDGPSLSLGSNLRAGDSATVRVTVAPPTLPEGVDRAQYRLVVDLHDTVGGVWFASNGNPPLENPVIVNKALRTTLGLERYYQYHGGELGAGMQHLVNVANGNSLVRWSPFMAPGQGLSTVLDLTYNSLEQRSESPIGNNWSLSISSLTRFGLPLDIHPNNADTIGGRSNRWIAFTDGDGTRHRFEGRVAADGIVYWEQPPGVHLYLYGLNGGGYALSRPDRVTFYYNADGYPTKVVDGNGNALTFTLEAVPPGEDPGGPKVRVTNVTDAGGRAFTITYYTRGEAPKPHVRGKIRTIADHTGSLLLFDYYEDGNLLRITQRGGSNADGTALADRTFVFTYTTSDGSGPAITDGAARTNPNPRTSNQSTRLYGVRDPRGAETTFSYYGPTSGQLRWRLAGTSDRSGATTAFSYDLTNRVATVTAPLSRVTKYAYDADGSVTAITNPLNQTTSLAWSADRHVTRITEPTGAFTTYAYNANGYLTERVDQLANKTVVIYENVPVNANDVSGKWESGRSIPHWSQLSSKTDPNGTATTTPTDDYQWLFDHDANGNLLTVTDPEGFVTEYGYNRRADGTVNGLLDWVRDANGNYTDFAAYDASGLPTEIREGLTSLISVPLATTRLGYDDDGLLRWMQSPLRAGASGGDPRQYRSYFDYDAFHRLGMQSAPKLYRAGSTEPLIWSAAFYDANDNVVREVGTHYGVQYTPSAGAATTVVYDAMDRATLVTGADRSVDTAGERTAYVYDAAGRVSSVTSPRGLQTATGQDFASFLTYDALDRVIGQSRHAVDSAGAVTQTLTSHACYDSAGDLRSVTAPNANLSSVDCASTTTPFTTRFEYDFAHRQTATIDPLAHRSSVTYDRNGNVVTSTDAATSVVTTRYNERNMPFEVVEPFDTGRTLTTRIEYDGVGNQRRVISPRAYDASTDKVTFTQYVTSFTYDSLNRLTRVDLPTSGANPQAQYVHSSYDANSNVLWSSLPVLTADPAQVTDAQRTLVSYLDTGWVATSDEPGSSPRIHFDYTAQGWQTSRTPENLTGGGLNTGDQMLWTYSVDGMIRERKDSDGHATTYTYDANNNLLTTVDGSGLTSPRVEVQVDATYDAFDRLERVRQREGSTGNYRFTTFTYDRDGNVVVREDDGVETPAGALVTTPRRSEYTYDAANWLSQQFNRGTTSATSDDERITNTFTATGLESSRVVARDNGSGGWTTQQTTAWTWFANGKLNVMTTKNGAGEVVESHTVSYTDTSGIYVNGHRTRDVFTLVGPDTAAPCRTSACTASYTYDARDRLVTEVNGHGATTTYTLDPAGNVTQEAITGDGARTTSYAYTGNQLTSATTGTATQRYFYDPHGNVDCVTTSTGTAADCAAPTGGTVSPRLLADYSYDYLNRLAGYRSFTTDGTTATADDTSSYVYDALDRVVRQTEQHGTAAARTTDFEFLGLTGLVTQERHTTSGTLTTTKDYQYDAYGHRIGMANTPAGGTSSRYSYGYDVHGSVSLLLSQAGTATASYGYRPYGAADDELTSGDFDPSDRTEATTRTDNPLNAFRYTGHRFDSGSGSLDMGARRFGPDTGRFLQADRYNGAVSDLGLSLDPLTANRYSFAGGNPLSFVEADGHQFIPDGGGDSSPPKVNGSGKGLETNTFVRSDKAIAFMHGEMVANAQEPWIQEMRAQSSRLLDFCPMGICFGDGLDAYNFYRGAEQFRATVCEGCDWDHKPELLERLRLGGPDVNFPIRGNTEYELNFDVWSNIHYGYVGRAAGIPAEVLDHFGQSDAAGGPDAADRISIQIGMDLWDEYGSNLTQDQLRRAVLSRYDEWLEDGPRVLQPAELGNGY